MGEMADWINQEGDDPFHTGEQEEIECTYVEVATNCISSVVPICPMCSDTKTVSTRLQTIKLCTRPEYRTECSECKIWWKTYKTDYHTQW